MFSSRRELAQEYAVDLTTVQRAIAPLPLMVPCARPAARELTWPARPCPAAPGTRMASALRPRQAAFLFTLWVLWAQFIPHGQADGGTARNGPGQLLRVLSAPSARRAHDHFLQRYISDYDFHPVREGIAACLAAGATRSPLWAFTMGPEIAGSILSAVDIDRVPVILVAGDEMIQPIPHVFYDNRSGGYLAAQHLLQQGYKDILFFSPFHVSWSEAASAGRARRCGKRNFLRRR